MTVLVSDLTTRFGTINAQLLEAMAETAANVANLNDQIATLREELAAGPAELSPGAEAALVAVEETAGLLADQNPPIEPPPVV